jgi:hypothetical protein
MKMQDGLDFFGGLAAGAGEGHGERSCDVEGGENSVRITSRKLFVGSGGEGVHRGNYAGVCGRLCGSEQDRKNKTFHGASPSIP